jgi:hypothetical protein
VSFRVGLDAVAKKKKPVPLPGIEPWSFSPYPIHYTAILTELFRLIYEGKSEGKGIFFKKRIFIVNIQQRN